MWQDGSLKEANSVSTLTPGEAKWRDRQRYFETQGYMLRPRYHPDWVPSWKKDSKLSSLDAEDSLVLPVSLTLYVCRNQNSMITASTESNRCHPYL